MTVMMMNALMHLGCGNRALCIKEYFVYTETIMNFNYCVL